MELVKIDVYSLFYVPSASLREDDLKERRFETSERQCEIDAEVEQRKNNATGKDKHAPNHGAFEKSTDRFRRGSDCSREGIRSRTGAGEDDLNPV